MLIYFCSVLITRKAQNQWHAGMQHIFLPINCTNKFGKRGSKLVHVFHIADPRVSEMSRHPPDLTTAFYYPVNFTFQPWLAES